MIEDNIEVNVNNTIEVIDVFPQITEEVVDINLLDNREDVLINVTESIIEVNINKVTNLLTAVWGTITGTLSSQTDLQSALNDKVPYTGATADVDLGTYGLISDYTRLNVLPTIIPTTVGTSAWNDSDGTMDLRLKGGNVTLQVGQENLVRVVNKSGVNLLESDYQVVRVRTEAEGGSQGQRIAVVLAKADTKANHTGILGIVTESITNNEEGFITNLGIVRGINTTGSLQGETWLDGDVLYLSDTTAGKITNIEPITHPIQIGYVTYAHNVNGKIFVFLESGVDTLDELHDVLISSVANNQGLFYDSATSLWKNKSIATVLGYTPISLSSLSASSPLSYNSGTGAFSIQVANTSQNGYLSSTNWNTFNGKIGGSGTSGYVSKFNGTGTTITNSLIYDNGTNVGIGTTNPHGKLELSNGTQSLLFSPVTAYNGPYIQSYNYASSVYLPIDYIALSHHFNTSGSEKMRLTNAGNLGIGTTSPDQKLVVIGNMLIPVGNSLYLVPGVTTYGIGTPNSSGTQVFAQDGDSVRLGHMGAGSAFTERLRVASGGNVGIGTTSPAASALLDVTSTTKGFLPPRMTNTQRLAISSPAVGLVVYVTTTVEEGLWVYQSTGWVNYNLI